MRKTQQKLPFFLTVYKIRRVVVGGIFTLIVSIPALLKISENER